MVRFSESWIVDRWMLVSSRTARSSVAQVKKGEEGGAISKWTVRFSREKELCLAISATSRQLLLWLVLKPQIMLLARGFSRSSDTRCHSLMAIRNFGRTRSLGTGNHVAVASSHDQLYTWRLLSLRAWRQAPSLLSEQISINPSMTVELPRISVGTTDWFVWGTTVGVKFGNLKRLRFLKSNKA